MSTASIADKWDIACKKDRIELKPPGGERLTLWPRAKNPVHRALFDLAAAVALAPEAAPTPETEMDHRNSGIEHEDRIHPKDSDALCWKNPAPNASAPMAPNCITHTIQVTAGSCNSTMASGAVDPPQPALEREALRAEQAASAGDLKNLVYAAILHHGKPKTLAEFERAADCVAGMMLRLRADWATQWRECAETICTMVGSAIVVGSPQELIRGIGEMLGWEEGVSPSALATTSQEAAAGGAQELLRDLNEWLAELGLHCECGQADCRTTRLRAALHQQADPTADQGQKT